MNNLENLEGDMADSIKARQSLVVKYKTYKTFSIINQIGKNVANMSRTFHNI